MRSDFNDCERTPLAANLPAERISVDRNQWLGVAEIMREVGATFLTLWGSDDRDRDGRFRVYATYIFSNQISVVEHALEQGSSAYPSVASFFPTALRLQRAIYDLLGITAEEPDTRNWLRHGGWPEDLFPLRRNVDANQQHPVLSGPYPFVSVLGDGVHEIAVGPVHAGTIEPGHFRFSVVGEKVLRLEERLGYTHKGVAKRFESIVQQDGHRLAARVSGDSAVAFSWAYCAALESITATVCPPRAIALRALALEHERLANHLGDLGALGNDAGFAFGLTQFSRLKEDLLRVNVLVFGARYLLDFVVPGGVAMAPPAQAPLLLQNEFASLERSILELRKIYDEHGGLQDRFREAGQVDRDTAKNLGAIGLVARASGIASDLRVDIPWPPYDTFTPKVAAQTGGDVAARVQVRFDEALESLLLCRAILETLPEGPICNPVPTAQSNRLGLGLIEAWRGPVMIALETGPDGTIRRCHPHDCSWQNWPILEYAIIGNIVPDFPLINKSFNLSYSGHDG